MTRAMLGWSAHQLVERSGISYSAIQRAKAVDGVASMRAPNLWALQKALEDGGVLFLSAGDSRPGGDDVRPQVHDPQMDRAAGGRAHYCPTEGGQAHQAAVGLYSVHAYSFTSAPDALWKISSSWRSLLRGRAARS